MSDKKGSHRVTCNQSEKSDVMMDKSKYFYEFVKLRVVNVIFMYNIHLHNFILLFTELKSIVFSRDGGTWQKMAKICM